MSLSQVTCRARLGLTLGILVAPLVLGFLTVQTGFADEQPKTEPTAPKPPPELDLVPRDAIGFITVRVADLWTSEIAKELRQRVTKEKTEELKELEDYGLTVPEIERFTGIHWKSLNMLIVVTTTKPYSLTKVLRSIGSEAEIKKDPEKKYYEGNDRALYVLNERTFISGSPKEVNDLLERVGKKTGSSLPEPWRLAKEKHHVVVGINPASVAKAVGMPVPQAFQPLLQSQSAALAVDFGVEVSADLQISFANAEQAKQGEKALKAGSAWLQGFLINFLDKEVDPEWEADVPHLVKLIGALPTALKNVPTLTKGTLVEAKLHLKSGADSAGGVLVELSRMNEGYSTGGYFYTEGQKPKDPTRSNLQRLAQAMLRYHKDHGHLPANAIYSKKGEPLLSWRVELLPYLNQQELYKQFKLDKPWDGPHNIELIDDMPEIFNDWGTSRDTKKYKATRFRVFSGKGAAFEGTNGLRLSDFLDGTSTTFLIVEAQRPVAWTKPDLLPYLPNRPLCKLGGLSQVHGFHAAFADGSVRFFKQETDEKTIRALITHNGGEKIRLPDER